VSRIEAIETVAYRLPLRGALAWGKESVLEAADGVLVRVRAASGASGAAEAPPRPTIYGETRASIEAAVRDLLAPRLVGRELADVEGARRATAFLAGNHTAKGALDMALHDALARERGVTLPELLGASASEVEVSYILGLADLETALAEARWVVDSGVRVFKVKVSGVPASDLERVRALRSELGAAVRLYLDANETFAPATAARDLERLREAGALWAEEPLPVERMRDRAALRARRVMPIIADDSTFSLRDLRRELEADTFDVLNLKPARTGYLESRRMLDLAREHGKGAMVGSQASTTIGTARAAAFAGLAGVDHPCELSFFLKLDAEIVDRPLEIRDGKLDLQAAARVEIDEARLRELSV
jgi:L-alanine-DL-glutamate epimerase-like enolase superfamily enzyme